MESLVFKKPMFGKDIEIILNGVDIICADEIIQNSYNLGLRLSKIFDFFDETSELSQLNKKRRFQVSNDLLIVIKKALEFSNLTKGKYDISLGKNILRRKNGDNLVKLNCSYKDIKIIGSEIVLNNPDVMIDLGSIAKGYIVDKMTESLLVGGLLQGLVNGRGDIRVFGDKPTILGVQNPRETDKLIKYIKLINKSVATSGDYNQYDRSFNNSHIINQSDVISVTVVADDLMTADIFATVLFVVDKKERMEILKKNRNIRVLTIDKDMKLDYYNGFEKLIVDFNMNNLIKNKTDESGKLLNK